MRLIGPDGTSMGKMHIKEALRIAQMQKMDLVEIVPEADPPVCKILDYDKFLYQEKIRLREMKRKQRMISMHQIRLSLNIKEHDYQVKLKKIKGFLSKKDRVKVTLRLKGRQILHKQKAIEFIEKLEKDLNGLGKLQSFPKIEGEREVSVEALFFPVKGGKDAKN